MEGDRVARLYVEEMAWEETLVYNVVQGHIVVDWSLTGTNDCRAAGGSCEATDGDED